MQLEIGDKTIGYYKFGEGKKNFIIIPGIGLRSAIPMGPFVEKAFAVFKEDYTVYLIERADVLNDSETIDSIAADYLAVFEKLGLKDLYIYGASLGGMICQSIAKQRPGMIRKMALASTVAGFTDTGKDFSGWTKLLKEKKAGELADKMLDDIYSKKVADSIRTATVKDASRMNDEELKRFSVQLEAALAFDSTSYLDEIVCPTLIIAAKGDKLFSYKESEYLHEKIKNSELCLYDETMPHAVYDEAGDVPERICSFFSK